MAANIPSYNEINQTLYCFHIPREHIREMPWTRDLGLSEEWYDSPVRTKDPNNKWSQDEYYWLSIERYLKKDGSITPWFLIPSTSDTNTELVIYPEVVIDGKQVLKLLYNISVNGHTIQSDEYPAF